MQALKSSTPQRLDQNFEMPSVPIVLSKILRLVDEDKASARRLEELIQHDPSLTIRILKLSNSAFYSFRSEVRTISHAIALLGLNLVRSLAIGVSIFESFTMGMKEQAGMINQLWMHSFAVGLISQDIWNRRSTRVQGEFALLCGLLHDMGKIVYFKRDASGYSPMFSMPKGPGDPDMCAYEIQSYGEHHADLGAQLMRRWNLPEELSIVVKHHHDPGAGGFPLVAAISMADTLVKQTGIGWDGDNAVSADLPGLQAMLKMEAAEFEALTLTAAARRAEVEDFFRLTT